MFVKFSFAGMLLIILCVCFVAHTEPQWNRTMDSLHQQVAIAKSDSLRSRLYSEISFQLYASAPDSGIHYGSLGLQIAERMQWNRGIALACNSLGTNYLIKSDYVKAVDYFTRALRAFEVLRDDARIASTLNNLGTCYFRMTHDNKALDCFQRSLVINKRLQSREGMANNFGNLGIIHAAMQQYEKSNFYYQEAYKLDMELGHHDRAVKHMRNTAVNQLNLGLYCESWQSYQEALRESANGDDIFELAVCYQGVAEFYLRVVDLKSIPNHNCVPLTMSHAEKLREGKSYLQKSLQLYDELGDVQSMQYVYVLLSSVFEKEGNFKEALAMHKIASAYADSVLGSDESLKIAELEKQHEVELREQKLQVQSTSLGHKNTIIILQVIIFSVIIFAVLLIGLIVLRKNRQLRAANAELARKNEVINQINSSKDKFFSIIAHDLTSPFMGFLGLTEMLANRAEMLSRESLNDLGKEMHKAASNLYALTKNLLEWAQIQNGMMTVQREMHNLQDVIQNAVQQSRNRAMQKQITVTCTYAENDIVFVDLRMIQSVLLNIIYNAIKFTNPGGTITIEVAPHTQTMKLIKISDTGIGIPEEMIPKLFRMDTKVSRTGTGGELSSGLGLLLCKEFIEKHDGKIWVESTVGKGSTFYFTLPLHQ